MTDYSLDVYLAQQMGINLDKYKDKKKDSKYNFDHLIDLKLQQREKEEKKPIRRGRKSSQAHAFKMQTMAVMSYPLSMKVIERAEDEVSSRSGQVGGQTTITRVAESLHREQEIIAREVNRMRITGGYKKESVAVELYHKEKMNKRKLRSRHDRDEFSENERKSRVQTAFSVKDRALCNRLTSNNLSLMDLENKVIKRQNETKLNKTIVLEKEENSQNRNPAKLDASNRISSLRSYRPKKARLTARLFSNPGQRFELPLKDEAVPREQTEKTAMSIAEQPYL